MESLQPFIIYIHLFGFAAVAGGLFTQLKVTKPEVSSLAIWGARAQLITGSLLWLNELDGFTHTGLTLKFLGATIILVVLEMYSKKPMTKKVYYALLAVLLLQVLVAVFFLEKASS